MLSKTPRDNVVVIYRKSRRGRDRRIRYAHDHGLKAFRLGIPVEKFRQHWQATSAPKVLGTPPAVNMPIRIRGDSPPARRPRC